MVYTSAVVTACHSVSYGFTNNAITGRVQSPGCCVQIENVNFASTGSTYDVGPVAGYATNCPSLVNRSGSMKLLATLGSGNSLCLIVAMCQSDYYGINVVCRGTPPLLLTIQILLINLLQYIGLIEGLALQPVNQNNCPSNNCP